MFGPTPKLPPKATLYSCPQKPENGQTIKKTGPAFKTATVGDPRGVICSQASMRVVSTFRAGPVSMCHHTDAKMTRFGEARILWKMAAARPL